jgi:uncharacterized protein (DUF1778 family)
VPPLKLSRWLKVRISAADDDRLRATAASLNTNVSAFTRRALLERVELEAILDRERVTNGDQASSRLLAVADAPAHGVDRIRTGGRRR